MNQDPDKIPIAYRDTVKQLSLMERAVILLMARDGKIKIIDR
jgi:hypothetical protein